MCLLASHLLQCWSSLCLHPGSGLLLSCFLYSIIMAAMVSLGRPWASSICSIFPLYMESKALEKLKNNIIASRFFARSPSRIRRIVKICNVKDPFLRKPFWFFQSIFSILGSMQLRSIALYILAAMDVRWMWALYLGSSWLIRGHPS